jgi:bifunctional UDP-N-acetylglucosamine pyrophosphorylase/glucosamine-1-phosphate N-acetyltransferase
MQAVVLAAGKSTRTYPLTLTKPKPLLKVANRTIIEHTLEQLDGLVNEVFIVVGYKANMVRNFLGSRFGKIRINYVVQDKPLGNADALRLVDNHIKGNFILMFGDDLYSKRDIRNLLKHKNAILAKKVENPQCFGVLEVKNGNFSRVVEKPDEFISDLVNVGCFVFSRGIFDVLGRVKLSKRNEYELTDAYNLMSRKIKIKVVLVEDYWLPITYPWNVLEANEFLLSRIRSRKGKKARIERGAVLEGKVVVGEGTVIRPGSYIEGPVIIGKECIIGPNCYLRGAVTVGDNCHIGQAVEVKNSIIGDNTNIAHLSYVGDSILGNGCNLGAGTITANLRHDSKSVKSMIGKNLVDSGRRKFGVVMGDNCKTGIHTSFYPGVKVDPNCATLPGEVIKRDLTAK